VYAHGVDDGVDLYIVPGTGGGGRRLSVGRGTDNVAPSISPDGRRIAFMSGRAGHPEIYTMDADGTNVDLLTPLDVGESAYRASPDWSPDGRQVVFQSRIGGGFQLMTVSLRDRSLKQLTSDGRNEDPSWAPDGRHLVFVSTRSGVRQLWVLDVESGRTRQLTRGAAVHLPAWSPRLAVN
jgi:TolB protein